MLPRAKGAEGVRARKDAAEEAGVEEAIAKDFLAAGERAVKCEAMDF